MKSHVLQVEVTQVTGTQDTIKQLEALGRASRQSFLFWNPLLSHF